MKARQFIIVQTEALHERIFGHPMSQSMRQFLSNLSWSFGGGFAASGIMLGVAVAAGRLLGPAEYGQYNLILTWSQLIMVPLMFGLDNASVLAVSAARTKPQQAKEISGPLFFFIGMSSLLVLGCVAIWKIPFLSQSLNMATLIYSATMAIIFGLKLLFDGFIRSLELFKYQTVGRVLEAVLIVILFTFWVIRPSSPSFVGYISALLVGSTVLILFYLAKIKPYIQRRVDWRSFGHQLRYGWILLVGSLLGALFNSLDKLIIARYLGIFELGVYGAYYAASTNLIAQGIQIFLNVFFPSVAKISHPQPIVKKINRLGLLGFIPGVTFFSFLIFAILKLFGQQYPLQWNLVFSFGLLATLQVMFTIYAYIIMATSKALYKKYLVYLNSLNALHIIAYGVVIYTGAISIQILVVMFIVNVAVAIGGQLFLLKRYQPE